MEAASKLVGLVRHEILDVLCFDSRWLVITKPAAFYGQEMFRVVTRRASTRAWRYGWLGV